MCIVWSFNSVNIVSKQLHLRVWRAPLVVVGILLNFNGQRHPNPGV